MENYTARTGRNYVTESLNKLIERLRSTIVSLKLLKSVNSLQLKKIVRIRIFKYFIIKLRNEQRLD
jgi:hypothetical protein